MARGGVDGIGLDMAREELLDLLGDGLLGRVEQGLHATRRPCHPEVTGIVHLRERKLPGVQGVAAKDAVRHVARHRPEDGVSPFAREVHRSDHPEIRVPPAHHLSVDQRLDATR